MGLIEIDGVGSVGPGSGGGAERWGGAAFLEAEAVAVFGERGVGMGGKLRAQRRILLRADLGPSPGPGPGRQGAALTAGLLPAADRPRVDAKPGDDLSRRPSGVQSA